MTERAIVLQIGSTDSRESHPKLREDILEGQENKLSSGLSYTYRLLSKVALMKKDYELAKQYIEQSFDMGERLSSPHDIAETKQCAAELEIELGNPVKAKKLANEAIAVFSKLRMKRQLAETQELLDRINTVEILMDDN